MLYIRNPIYVSHLRVRSSTSSAGGRWFSLHSYPSIFTRLSSCYNAFFEIYRNFIVFLGFSVDVQLDASAKRLALSCSESGAGAPAKHGCVFLFFKRGQVAMHYNELNLSLSLLLSPSHAHTHTYTVAHLKLQ